MQCPSLPQIIHFVLKNILSDSNQTFQFSFGKYYFHSIFVSSLCKLIFCKQHRVGSCFFTQSNYLCLLTRMFKLFTYSLITNMFAVKSTILIFFSICLIVLCSSFLHFLISSELIIQFLGISFYCFIISWLAQFLMRNL